MSLLYFGNSDLRGITGIILMMFGILFAVIGFVSLTVYFNSQRAEALVLAIAICSLASVMCYTASRIRGTLPTIQEEQN